MMKKLQRLTILAALVTTAFAAPKTIAEYFLAIPRQPFTEGSPQQLLEIIKRGENGSLLDSKNGYMNLTGDGAQASLQIALFRYDDKSPLLVVAWGDLEEADFTHVTLFREQAGKMIPAERTMLPVADSKNHRFELPRYGRTIIVRDAKAKVLSKWSWNGKKFVKE